jgi:hypothetical protein
MRITEEINESGYFWLDTSPKIKYPGILSINDGGQIELEITEPPNFDYSQIATFEKEFDMVSRIYGQTEKYSFVMLNDCQLFNKKNALALGTVSKSFYSVRMAFLNHMLVKNIIIAIPEKEIATKVMCFSVEGLDEWIGPTGFEYVQQKSGPSSIIKYTRPDEINAVLENGMILSIYFTHATNFPFIGEARMTNNAHFRLTSENEIGLNNFISVAKKIVELFCFFFDKK